MSNVRFHLNGQPVLAENLQPTSTLLRWLRENKGLTGTKEGCAEGDCGACSVVIADPLGEGGTTLRSVNSCLVLTPTLEGQHVFTVEGCKPRRHPHPRPRSDGQAPRQPVRLLPPGFIMAMAEGAHRTDLDEPWKLNDQLCGNLCRCTGYRPIRDALRDVAGTCPLTARLLERLAAQSARSAPRASRASAARGVLNSSSKRPAPARGRRH